MRLKNKKTGEIREAADVIIENLKKNGSTLNSISLDEIRNEWEDYEKPKEYWYIELDGGVYSIDRLIGYDLDKLKDIGNYFETREEAEKAVEKVKAWKRLKDSGISFEAKVADGKWHLEPKAEPQQRTFDEAHDLFKDVMFIFGGEE